MATLFINGKFFAQRITGVQRYAREMLRCMDELWTSSRAPVLLVPGGVSVPAFQRIEVETLGAVGVPLLAWEQALLPWRARGGLLLNLAGSAPAFVGRRLVTAHDAAVFDWPSAYTPAFRSWYRWLFRRVSRQDEFLATVSSFSRDRLVAALQTRPERLLVLPGSGDHFLDIQPDSSVLARLRLENGRFWLAVATRNPTKRLDLLLTAWFQHAEPSQRLPLVLVGGSNSSVFEEDGWARPTEHGVIDTGVVNDAELKALLCAATALVLPSVYEGFGLTALEAMTCGCPVIAAKAAALPEVVGDAAFWVPADDVAALGAALVQLARDDGSRQRLSEAGHARARLFSWRTSALRLMRHLGCIP